MLGRDLVRAAELTNHEVTAASRLDSNSSNNWRYWIMACLISSVLALSARWLTMWAPR